MALSSQNDAMALFSTVVILAVTLTFTFCNLQTPEGQFLKLIDVKPSYGARATADRHIPELINSGKSSYADGKMPESQTKPSH